jgi:hypothetical protein
MFAARNTFCPERFSSFIRAEMERNGRIMKMPNLKVELASGTRIAHTSL